MCLGRVGGDGCVCICVRVVGWEGDGVYMCVCLCVRVVGWEGDEMGGKKGGSEGRSALGMCISVGAFLTEIAC